MAPDTSRAAYVDDATRLFGAISLGEGSSVWPFVAMRAELHAITIGRFVNIQDFAMLHIGYEQGTAVGEYCSITHRATLHGCTIEPACLIGIGATIMDGSVIGRGSIVAGGSFVREGTIVPPGSIVMGTPAKVVRQRDSTRDNVLNALLYHHNALAYAGARHDSWRDLDRSMLTAQADRIAAQMADQAPTVCSSLPR